MKTNFKNKIGGSTKPGFVVLFTVLIASVVLSMALGIANIALKQIVLTASSTDANKSFYAADAGVECALYHDMKVPAAFDVGTVPLNCMSAIIPVTNLGGVYSFQILIPSQNDSGDLCASVTVDKTSLNRTVVTSRGKNNQCGFDSARTVERAIEVTY